VAPPTGTTTPLQSTKAAFVPRTWHHTDTPLTFARIFVSVISTKGQSMLKAAWVRARTMNYPGRNCHCLRRCCRFVGLIGWLVVGVTVMMIGTCSTAG
jgi:hypothetical protein